MKTENYEWDIKLVEAIKSEMTNKKLPLHVQTGIAFKSECGNLMMPVQIDYPDDFDLNVVLCEVINKAYNLI